MSDDPKAPQGGNSTEPGGEGGSNPPTDPGSSSGGQGALTQDDLNRAAGNARRAAREAAIKDLLGELGVEKLDDLKAAYQSFREAEDQRKSDLDKANEKASNLESANAQLTQQLNAERVEREVERQALALGANPERLEAVGKLRGPSEGEVDSEGKLNADAIKQSVEAVLSAYPEFMKKGAPNVGDGSNPGGGSDEGTKIDVSNMSAEEFAELQRRVMAGERVEIK